MNSRDDDIARDRQGNPIVDRFGRPVRRRSPVSPSPSDATPRTNNARPNQASGASPGEPKPPRYIRRTESVPPAAPPQGGPGPGQPHQYPPHRGPQHGGPQNVLPQHGSPHNVPPQHGGQPYRGQQPPGGGQPHREPYPEIPSQRRERLQQFSHRSPHHEPAGGGRRRSSGGKGVGRGGVLKNLLIPGRRPRIERILAAIVLIIAVTGVGTLVWADSKLQRTDAIQKYDGRLSGTKGTNWLLVGSDSRAGLTAEDADRLMAGELDESGGRTDTIMLIHIPLGGQARMVSFPRDSWVNIPGYGEDKINAAFALGGPALLQRTIEEATGIHIDRYAEIGFGGFANAVDGVGGIKMCLDEPLQDDMAGIDLPAGCQKLDGPNALGFVRSRYTSANGDLDRVDRQRQFLAALSKKMMSPGTILNPFRLLPTVGGVASALTVNSKDHMWHLARLGLKMRSAKQESVPTGAAIDTYSGNALQWDEAAAEQLFSELR